MLDADPKLLFKTAEAIVNKCTSGDLAAIKYLAELLEKRAREDKFFGWDVSVLTEEERLNLARTLSRISGKKRPNASQHRHPD